MLWQNSMIMHCVQKYPLLSVLKLLSTSLTEYNERRKKFSVHFLRSMYSREDFYHVPSSLYLQRILLIHRFSTHGFYSMQVPSLEVLKDLPDMTWGAFQSHLRGFLRQGEVTRDFPVTQKASWTLLERHILLLAFPPPPPPDLIIHGTQYPWAAVCVCRGMEPPQIPRDPCNCLSWGLAAQSELHKVGYSSMQQTENVDSLCTRSAQNQYASLSNLRRLIFILYARMLQNLGFKGTGFCFSWCRSFNYF